MTLQNSTAFVAVSLPSVLCKDFFMPVYQQKTITLQ